MTLYGNNVGIGPNNLSITLGVQSGATLSGPASTITLTPGTVASGSISGTLLAGVTPLSGVVVYLVESGLPVTGAFNPSINPFTTTNANGQYTFSGLAAGSYTVMELIPADIEVTSPTNDSSGPINVAEGQQVTGINFTNLRATEWGAYSATAIDPSNPGVFWTFQSFTDDQSSGDFNTWAVQATELAVTNFTSDTIAQNLATSSIPVTITATSPFFNATGNDTTDIVRASIPKQSTDTTIYLDFGGSSPGSGNQPEINVDYSVIPLTNAAFVTGAPVQIIIPAGQTFGTIELAADGVNSADTVYDKTVTVSVYEINLAAPAVPETPLNLTLTDQLISIEDQAVIETGPGATTQAVVTVRLSTATATPLSVQYQTEDNTATAGIDYTANRASSISPPGRRWRRSRSPSSTTRERMTRPPNRSLSICLEALRAPAPSSDRRRRSRCSTRPRRQDRCRTSR